MKAKTGNPRPNVQAEVLTIEEARKVLRLGKNAAYQAVENGDIPSIRIGRRILVPRAALERLLDVQVRGAA